MNDLRTDSSTAYPHGADPDPIAVMTICFAGIGMVSGVAATVVSIVESRRSRRQEANHEREAWTELQIIHDRMAMPGRQIMDSIDSLERNSQIALSFTTQRPNDKFAMGKSVVTVSGASRSMWDLLIDDICMNIKTLNRYVLEYSELLPELFASARRMQGMSTQASSYLHHAFREVFNLSVVFHQTLEKFQGITSRTPLVRAQSILKDLCNIAISLIQAMDTQFSDLERISN
jgi:hypothetical protein